MEAIAETMAERTSKERKIIANEFDFRNYVTTEKTKFRRQQKGRQKGNAQRGNQLAFGSFGIKALERNGLQAVRLKLRVLQ